MKRLLSVLVLSGCGVERDEVVLGDQMCEQHDGVSYYARTEVYCNDKTHVDFLEYLKHHETNR